MEEESDRPGLPLSVRYRFVHVFYQNALYASLTPSRRVVESLAVAGALTRSGPAAVQEAMAGELAVLYEIGREYSLAAQHFLQAARNAARVFAYPETVLLVERGLRALATLPESPERDGQELLFSLMLGMALMSTRGYAAPEVEHTHRRSRELCLKQKEVRRLVPVLWGIHTCETNGGRLMEALNTAHEIREAAELLGHRESLVTSLHALGTTLAFMGRLPEAREALERILALTPPEQHELRGSLYVLDPLVTTLSMLGRLLTLMGDGEAAQARATESVTLANRLGHPHSLAYATFWTGWILQFQGWHAASLEALESTMKLGRTHGFPLIVEWARVVRGSALVHLDRRDEALAEIRKSIERQDAMGSKLERAYCLTVFAEAMLRNGQSNEAIEKCDEALVLSQRTGGKCYDTETLRVRGEALLAQFGPSRRTEAEADFLHAIQQAREWRCTLLELRAAMSYHRCQCAAGDGAAARLDLERAAASFRPIEAPLAGEAKRQLGLTR